MSGICDIAQVGFVVFIQWRRHADNNCVHFDQTGVIRRCRKAARLCVLDVFRGNAVDIGPTLRECVYLARVNVEARYRELLLDVEKREWQSYIAKSYDRNSRLAGLDLVL